MSNLFLPLYRRLVADGAPIGDLAAADLTYWLDADAALHSRPLCPRAEGTTRATTRTLAALAAGDGAHLCGECAQCAVDPNLAWLPPLAAASARQAPMVAAAGRVGDVLAEGTCPDGRRLRMLLPSLARLRCELAGATSVALRVAASVPENCVDWLAAQRAAAHAVYSRALNALGEAGEDAVTAAIGACPTGPARWVLLGAAPAALTPPGARDLPAVYAVLRYGAPADPCAAVPPDLLRALPGGLARELLSREWVLDGGPASVGDAAALADVAVTLWRGAAAGDPLADLPTAVDAARAVLADPRDLRPGH